MINPRITDVGHVTIVPNIPKKIFKPDFEADNHLYREFGMNSEIDIMRNNPQYEGVVNSKLKQVSDFGLDTSEMTDEQLAISLDYGRSFDENEIAEAMIRQKDERLNELRKQTKQTTKKE